MDLFRKTIFHLPKTQFHITHTIDASLTFGSRVWLAESYLALVSIESVSKKNNEIYSKESYGWRSRAFLSAVTLLL